MARFLPWRVYISTRRSSPESGPVLAVCRASMCAVNPNLSQRWPRISIQIGESWLAAQHDGPSLYKQSRTSLHESGSIRSRCRAGIRGLTTHEATRPFAPALLLHSQNFDEICCCWWGAHGSAWLYYDLSLCGVKRCWYWDGPRKTRRWLNVGLMLGQRRRRWANNNLTLSQRLVIAGP